MHGQGVLFVVFYQEYVKVFGGDVDAHFISVLAGLALRPKG